MNDTPDPHNQSFNAKRILDLKRDLESASCSGPVPPWWIGPLIAAGLIVLALAIEKLVSYLNP